MRPIAVIIAPFAQASLTEVERVQDAARHLLAMGWVPIFLPWALREILDDGNTFQRATALECSGDFVERMGHFKMARGCVRAFVVGQRITEGMRLDIDAWRLACGYDPSPLCWDQRDGTES